jgi:hypothetical protein
MTADKIEVLQDIENRSWRQFDETMITLSAGALGLSIAFVRNIVKQPGYKYMLATAWCCFGATLVVMVFSFMLSICAVRKEATIEMGQGEVQETNRADSILNIMNWGALVIFSIGVMFLALFALLNYV